MTRYFVPMLCLALTACGGPHFANPVNFGTATNLTCVPYARAVSGIELSGDAYKWWGEAAGRYPRSHQPSLGAVLVFAPHGAMDVGHLAVVTAVTGPRKILVTQSNWLPGRIEHDQPVWDVSAANNWTRVRVWYEPAHEMGRNIYPTYGFILPRAAPP
ncbi:MAG: CHAP domain-containing protein [Acidocella sp.]|nr:CHAP domain-containing protein [Acidocella sp.]